MSPVVSEFQVCQVCFQKETPFTCEFLFKYGNILDFVSFLNCEWDSVLRCDWRINEVKVMWGFLENNPSISISSAFDFIFVLHKHTLVFVHN